MDLDTFEQLPIHMDPHTKALTASSQPASSDLAVELAQLNALHRALITSDAPQATPPPPLPVNPKRSAQITKLRDAGNASFRKGAYSEAAKLYSLGIDMAAQRPLWEPSGLVREEMSALYSNRAQAYMAQGLWAEGSVDAECSVELKKGGNAKAWWRRAKSLLEMGRLEEARAVLEEALEFEGPEQDLVALRGEIMARTGANKSAS